MRVPRLGEIGRAFRVHDRSSQYVFRLCLQTCGRQTRSIHHQAVDFEGILQGLVDDTQTLVQKDNDFLRRASRYGIQSLQELDRQGRYHNQIDTSQLIQNDAFRSDIQLWQLLLDYQAHYYGSQGVKSIYRLLKYQGPLVRLTSESEAVSALWKQMLLIAARETKSFDLFNLLCERNGIAWSRPKLFAEAIATLLEVNQIEKALLMCDKLLEKRSNKLGAALEIVQAFRPERTEDFARFLTVYQKLQPLKIYDKAMEELWQSNRKEEAVLLHKLLISQGDVPSSFHYIEALMLHLAATNQATDAKKAPEAIIQQLLAAGVDYSHRAWHVYKVARQNESANKNNSPKIGSDQAIIPSKRTSESFATKAFATSALPFEFVLNSMKAFGLTEIGPQTMREIGLVAKDLDTLRNRLDILHRRGVDTGASAYVRTIRKLCKKGHAGLLTEVLKTDIHHEVFEDSHLQWHLISDHVKKCDWSKVNLLLTILCQGAIREQAANVAKTALLLRPNRRGNQHRAFLNYAMQVHDPYRASETFGLRNSIKSMIVEMRSQKRDQFTPHQQLVWARFVAGLMQEAVLGGQRFEVLEWRHVLSRIGGRGMPDLAIGLIYWIVRLQHGTIADLTGLIPLSSGSAAAKPIPISKRLSRLGVPVSRDLATDSGALQLTTRLVDTRFQQSLMHWSLQHSLHEKTRKRRETWQNCLELLRLLEQKYGIPMDLKALKRVIVMRCRYLRPKRFSTKSQSSFDHARQSADEMSPERSKEMNRNAWRECSRVIGELHNLWRVSPAQRSADLDIAFEALFARKEKFTRPFQRGKGLDRIDDMNYDYL